MSTRLDKTKSDKRTCGLCFEKIPKGTEIVVAGSGFRCSTANLCPNCINIETYKELQAIRFERTKRWQEQLHKEAEEIRKKDNRIRGPLFVVK